MGAILALLLLLARGTPVHAHPLATQAVVGVAQNVTVNIGVPADEGKALVGVDITIPGGFDLTRVVPVSGWTVEQSKDVVRFRGGTIAAGQFVLFSLNGVFPKRGTYKLPLVLVAADGSITRWKDKKPSDPYPAATVYAGTRPQGTDGGTSSLETVSKAAALGGGIGLALALLLRLRRRDETPEE
jgi:uncharacterized protein YcnI